MITIQELKKVSLPFSKMNNSQLDLVASYLNGLEKLSYDEAEQVIKSMTNYGSGASFMKPLKFTITAPFGSLKDTLE